MTNAALLWHFHDRYWYPTDDGLHAHIAERLVAGEVLHRDAQDIHPGYAHFLNAFAFRAFGVDIVSLRYPLIAAALLQSALVFLLLRRRGVLLAAMASLAGTALGVIQFMSTTANWYCLSLAVALACWLSWLPAGHSMRLVGAGVLLGTLTFFRQLTGVWVAMAIFVVALLEEERDEETRPLLARGLVAIMLLALVGYLALTPAVSFGSVVLVAVWPLAMLVWLMRRTRTSNARVAAIVGQVGLGCVLSALPAVLYHLANGSVGVWLNDILIVATSHTQLPNFSSGMSIGWHDLLIPAGLYQALSAFEPVKIANGIYWVIIPLLSVANGVLLLPRVRQRRVREIQLPVIAAFYALVSLYLPGPLYLYYTAGLTLAAVVWLESAAPPWRRAAWLAGGAGLAIVAVAFHAGQSRHRTPQQILAGSVDTDVWHMDRESLPRTTIRIGRRDLEIYRRFIRRIESDSLPHDTMLVLPNNAELYFLSRRANVSRFYNSTMGLMNERDVHQLLVVIKTRKPRLVIFRRGDKFVTAEALQVMAYVMDAYELIETIDGADVYRRRNP